MNMFLRRNLLMAGGALAGGTVLTSLAGEGDGGLPSGGMITEVERPKVPRPVFAFDAIVLLEQELALGRTPYGERFRVPIIGGEFVGPHFRAKVLTGGADWQLLRHDGYFVIEADYFIETEDNIQIHVVNKGLWFSQNNDWPAEYAVSTPVFEVQMGKYDWLNQHIFTGTIAPGPAETPSVRLAIYRLV